MDNLQPDPGGELGLVTLVGLAEQSTTKPRTETYSILLRTRFGEAGKPDGDSQATWPNILTVQPGHKYWISFWANSDDVDVIVTTLIMELDSGDGVFDLVQAFVPVIGPDIGWDVVQSISFIADGTQARIRFRTELPSPPPVMNDRWYVDDITVEEVVMPETQVSICNIALSRVGVKQKISAIDEQNPDAEECNLHYNIELRKLLRAGDWSFARREAALVTAVGTPPTRWGYQYTYPSDCMHARRIEDGLVQRRNDQRIQFRIFNVAGSKLIYCNVEDACLIYTIEVTDPTLYPDDFANAMAWALAAAIAPSLADDPKMVQNALTMAEHSIQQALAGSFNEEEEGPEPDAQAISVRN